MEWNDDTIGRLRVLWDEGLSTAEIGRRLGVSKNAVVGKAHRMMLPARPSPIRRDGGRVPRMLAPRRVTGPTLPPLAVAVPMVFASVASAPLPNCAAEPPARVLAVAAETDAPPRAPRPMAVWSGRLSACCWPLGDPGTPSFSFCDAASLPGKPYCGEHAQLAYVKVRDRREEAA